MSLQLDARQLQAENGTVYLLRWLRETERWIETSEEEKVAERQNEITESLLGLVTETPAIAPGRAVQKYKGRIVAVLLRRTQRRGMFDLMQQFLANAQGVKNADSQVASLGVVEQAFATFGSDIAGLAPEAVAIGLRMAHKEKTTYVRKAAVALVTSAIQGTSRDGRECLTDSAAKDTLKSLRGLLGDKALAVVREAANALLALWESHVFVRNLANLNAIAASMVKAFEHSDQVTQRSLACVFAPILASTQTFDVQKEERTLQQRQKAELEKQQQQQAASPAKATADVDLNMDAAPTAETTMLSPSEMLNVLAGHYLRPTTGRKSRLALSDVYGQLMLVLGREWVEDHYKIVLAHLVREIGSRGVVSKREYRPTTYGSLLSRSVALHVLHDIISARLLSERAQQDAIDYLCEEMLVVKGDQSDRSFTVSPETPQTLVIALNLIACIMGLLEYSGTHTVSTSIRDTLVKFIFHQGADVRAAAAWALRTYVDVTSSEGDTIVDALFLQLDKYKNDPSETGLVFAESCALALSGVARATLNHIEAARIDTVPRIMRYAFSCIESGSRFGWILVAPTLFAPAETVSPHLNTLFRLWRSSIPVVEPSSPSHWVTCLRDVEAALSSLLAFLLANQKTDLFAPNSSTVSTLFDFRDHAGTSGVSFMAQKDTARRVTAIVSNALVFWQSFTAANVSAKISAKISAKPAPGTSEHTLLIELKDVALALRRRLLQCVQLIIEQEAAEPLVIACLNQAAVILGDPERYTGPSLAQVLAGEANNEAFDLCTCTGVTSPPSSGGSNASIWETCDGSGSGVSSHLELHMALTNGASDDPASLGGPEFYLGAPLGAWLNKDPDELRKEQLYLSPVLGALEYDALVVGLVPPPKSALSVFTCIPAPVHAGTASANAAVHIFGRCMHLALVSQNTAPVESLFKAIQANVSSCRNALRRQAITANVTLALVEFARHPSRASVQHPALKLVESFLWDIVVSPVELRVKSLAAEALGRLAGRHVLGVSPLHVINTSIRRVVSSPDVDSRIGSVLVLAHTHSHIGALTSTPLVKTTLDVLLTLSMDPHPSIHFFALIALAHVIDVASTAVIPLLPPILGVVSKAYISSSHDPSGGSLGSANLRSNLPAIQAIACVVDAVVQVFGPELQSLSLADSDSDPVQNLLLSLVKALSLEADEGVATETLAALQHIFMFSPQSLPVTYLVPMIQSRLRTRVRRPLKIAAVNAVYTLLQKDSLAVTRIGGHSLARDLFSLLNEDPTIDGIKKTLALWIDKTRDLLAQRWLTLCMGIINGVPDNDKQTWSDSKEAHPSQDEEVSSLGLTAESSAASRVPRWRVVLFALECISSVLDHSDAARVPDLIRVALTASASKALLIRVAGLGVLRQVITRFSSFREIDSDEKYDPRDLPSVLEQYQAPIAAALAPAFQSESNPTILANAIPVCVDFIVSGIVRKLEKMGRILSLLNNCLSDALKYGPELSPDDDADSFSFVGLQNLNSVAYTHLRFVTLGAWARIQLLAKGLGFSHDDVSYLGALVEPHLGDLAVHWQSSLISYATWRGAPDLLGPSEHFAVSFYEQQFVPIVHAYASSLDRSQEILAEEIFWPIFGLVFEPLCESGSSGLYDSSRDELSIIDATTLILAKAPRSLAMGSTGPEMRQVFQRLVTTRGPAVQYYALRALAKYVQLIDDSSKKQLVPFDRMALSALESALTGIRTRKTAEAIGIVNAATDALLITSRDTTDTLSLVLSQVVDCILSLDASDERAARLLSVVRELMSKGFTEDADHFIDVNLNAISLCVHVLNVSQTAPTSNVCRQNALLLVLVLVNAIPAHAKVSEDLLENLCAALVGASAPLYKGSVQDVAPDTITAFKCVLKLVTSGLSAFNTGSSLVRCVPFLFAPVVEFLVKAHETREMGENADAGVRALTAEGIKVLSLFAAAFAHDPQGLASALALVVPVCVTIGATPTLLVLAQQYTDVFRHVSRCLDEGVRDRLQGLLRAHAGPVTPRSEKKSSTIELRSFAS